jgi:hypothetical protein
VRPILQNRIQIKTHPEKMIEHLVFNCQSWRTFKRGVLAADRRFPQESNWLISNF